MDRTPTLRALRPLAPVLALALLLGTASAEPGEEAGEEAAAGDESAEELAEDDLPRAMFEREAMDAVADARVPDARGVFLTRVPSLPLSSEVPSVDEIRGYVAAGDHERALLLAERLVADKAWGRDRNAAWFTIGVLERERGHHNRASEAFTKVRAVTSPLAELAAYYEAEQDLVRGKPWVALRECERYEETYPSGRYVAACTRVRAKASALTGRGHSAEEIAEAYDLEHTDAPIGESIALLRAEVAFEAGRDREAVRRFRELAIDHTTALAGRVAEERLAELAARGVEGASVPDSVEARRQRAVSLRDAGRIDEAWAVYEELAAEAEGDPAAEAWVEAALEVFAKRTRHYDPLIAKLEAEFAERPQGTTAAEIMHLLGRAGRWDEAASYARLGMEKYPRVRGFSRNEEVLGRTLMLGGDYEGAREAFGTLEKRGGWRGRRGRFLGAFAALMHGDAEAAEASLAKVIDSDAYRRSAGHYWRAAALTALERHDEAREAQRTLLATDPYSWYGVLTRAQLDVDTPVWNQLEGRWWGPEDAPPSPMPPSPTPLAHSFAEGAPAWSPLSPPHALGLLGWPLKAADSAPVATATLLLREPTEPPPSYEESQFFSRYEAGRELDRLVERHGEAFPDTATAYELARIGLYDLSGPLFSDFFEEYKEARRSRSHPANDAARALYLQDDEWRQLFLYTRDHHHTARYLHGLDERLTDPVQQRQALSLGWPLAHDEHVWSHSHEHDVDPFMVMALMRAESTYNSIAVSRVGARGAMQIMPRTGHLLADLAHDEGFTAGDLEDPVLAVEYGITYLGLLQDRFDGVFPLAVASYNGGPHNVSSWIRGTGADMPIDAFVEHIPFRETRRYVRRVSGNYATYVDLYGPGDTLVVPPRHIRQDDKTVVDF